MNFLAGLTGLAKAGSGPDGPNLSRSGDVITGRDGTIIGPKKNSFMTPAFIIAGAIAVYLLIRKTSRR